MNRSIQNVKCPQKPSYTHQDLIWALVYDGEDEDDGDDDDGDDDDDDDDDDVDDIAYYSEQ